MPAPYHAKRCGHKRKQPHETRNKRIADAYDQARDDRLDFPPDPDDSDYWRDQETRWPWKDDGESPDPH